MNKLTKILFTRPIGRDAIASRASAAFHHRKRWTLVCVWMTDPGTGRLFCSWTKPTDVDRCFERHSNEPAPSVRIAA